MVDFDLDGGTAGAGRPLPTPRECDVIEASLSPDERSVVWHVYFMNRTPDWIERSLSLFRSNKFHPYVMTQALFVSRSDGSDMREIGRIRCPLLTRGLWSVGWDRTGEHICFILDHHVYTIPVPS